MFITDRVTHPLVTAADDRKSYTRTDYSEYGKLRIWKAQNMESEMKNLNMTFWKTSVSTVAIVFLVLLLSACGGAGPDGGSGNNAGAGGSGSGGDSGSTGYGTATLSWLPPTEYTDGSPLTDLAGYKIYYGTAVDDYPNVITIDNPGIATYVIDNLPAGNTYYFVITAFGSDGIESDYSAVGSKTIPA